MHNHKSGLLFEKVINVLLVIGSLGFTLIVSKSLNPDNSQVFEIFIDNNEIDQIHEDYLSMMGEYKTVVERDSIESTFEKKGDIIIFDTAKGRFALKLTIDAYVEYFYNKGDTIIGGNDVYETLPYYLITPDSVKFEIVVDDDFSNSQIISSNKLLEYAEQGKWLGKYEGLTIY